MGADVEQSDSRQKMESLLGSRKETLALYNELAASRPFDENDEVKIMLQEFCESLMDYTASAHFQLYRFIEEGTERRENVRVLAEEVYPNISETTEKFLNFNDKYEADDKLDSLDQDLSVLGEALADRILYEDKVITAFQSRKDN